MAGQTTTIGGRLYYSSDTAGRGDYGTTGAWGGQSIRDQNGQLWFPGPWAAQPATPVAPPAGQPPSATAVLPDLAGATWGHIIPVTAGVRSIPGRPVELRIIKSGDAYVMDALISFGWRADLRAGDPTPEFTPTKLLANGIRLYELAEDFTAEGLTLTFYDGTQTTADPFWEGIYGAGEVPAYINHILVNVQGMLLSNFGNRRPDKWTLFVEDSPVLSIVDGGIRPLWDPDTMNIEDAFSLTEEDATATLDEPDATLYTSILSVDAIEDGSLWAVEVGAIPGPNYWIGIMRANSGADWPQSDFPHGFAWKPDGKIRKGPTSLAQFTMDTYVEGDVLLFARVGNNFFVGKRGSGWCMYAGAFPGSFAGYTGDPCNDLGSVEDGAGETFHVAFGADVAGASATIVLPTEEETPVCLAGAVEVGGLTIARCYELLAGLTRHISGKVNCTDTRIVSGLYVVEERTWLEWALQMADLFGHVIREDNDEIDIVRPVVEATYTVNATFEEEVIIRMPGQAGITFNYLGDIELPSEVTVQFIATEYVNRYSERPARRNLGPLPTTLSTKKETIRVPITMPVADAQTHVSHALYRKIEGKVTVKFALPWMHAIKLQAGDVVEVEEGAKTHTVLVARADKQGDRTVEVVGQKSPPASRRWRRGTTSRTAARSRTQAG
jgi:hypothetical protein